MIPGARERLRTRLEEVLLALDESDDRDVHTLLLGLAEVGEGEVLSELSGIVQSMRAGVDALSIDEQLTRAAATDLPDLVARLDAVIQSSEAAALRTLDLVEEGQARVRDLQALALNKMDIGPAGYTDTVASLRQCFSAIAEAQSYQDLNGQTIKKAIHLLGGVEDSLVAVLTHAGVDVSPRTGPRNESSNVTLMRGNGPRIEGLDTPAVSQQEADDLLSNLGL